MSGRIDAIAPDLADPDRVIVGSAGGGIWGTQSGGAAWASLGSLADATVLHLERDRSIPSRLYALTAADLYASTDEGASWTNLTATGGHPWPHTQATISDPFAFTQMTRNQKNLLFFAFPWSPLYCSEDGGRTLHRTPLLGGDSAISLTADDATGRVYYSSAAHLSMPAEVVRSAPLQGCGGLTWELASAGLPGYPQNFVLVWGREPGVLYAAGTGSQTGMYVTSDGGASWTSTSGALGNGPIWDARALLVPERSTLLVGAVESFESQDSGSTFQQFTMFGPHNYLHPDVRALALAAGRLWEGSDGTGLDDSGTSTNLVRWWYAAGGALSGPEAILTSGAGRIRTWQTYYALRAGGVIHVGSQDNGSACSADGSATWTSLTGGNGCADFVAMAVAPSNPSRAYAQTCDASSILRTDDAQHCRSWTQVAGDYIASAVHWGRHMIAVDPKDADHFAVTASNRVAISHDGGVSQTFWDSSSVEDQSSALLYDATSALWIGTRAHGVYRTTDDGATTTNLPLNASVYALAWSPTTNGIGIIYAATTAGLLRSVDGAAFEPILGGSGYVVSEVEVDKDDPQVLYAGFGFDIPSVHRGGVARSSDGGSSWSSLTAGTDVHASPVSSIQSLGGGKILVATYGRGVWSYSP